MDPSTFGLIPQVCGQRPTATSKPPKRVLNSRRPPRPWLRNWRYVSLSPEPPGWVSPEKGVGFRRPHATTTRAPVGFWTILGAPGVLLTSARTRPRPRTTRTWTKFLSRGSSAASSPPPGPRAAPVAHCFWPDLDGSFVASTAGRPRNRTAPRWRPRARPGWATLLRSPGPSAPAPPPPACAPPRGHRARTRCSCG